MNNFNLLLSANFDFNVVFVLSAILLFAGIVLFLILMAKSNSIAKSNLSFCENKICQASTRSKKSRNLFSIMIIPSMLVMLLFTFCISLAPVFSAGSSYATSKSVYSSGDDYEYTEDIANSTEYYVEKELPLDCLVSIDNKVPTRVGGSEIVGITYIYSKSSAAHFSVGFYGEIRITLKSGSILPLVIIEGTLTLYDHHAEIDSSFNERYPAANEETRKNNLKDKKIDNVFAVLIPNYWGSITDKKGVTLKNTYFIVEGFSSSWYNASWVDEVNDFLDKNLVTIITALLVGAALLAVILGIMLAKAESADAIAKAKKRMWGLLIGIVIIIVLILILRWVLDNFSNIQSNLDEIRSDTLY